MTYKETFFFVARCLTINLVEKNKVLVENELKSGNLDWGAIVKVSTSHLVFPALYCNLKSADFLNYLPEDLIEHMKYITDLNRERNEQIVAQAKEINTLLLEHNIAPIFLKGTGNLVEALYDDIAERMVGDIDLLISEEDCNKAYKILEKYNYKKVTDIFDEYRHLPRLTHPKKIAAVEIHRAMLKKNKSSSFNHKTIKQTLIFVDQYYLLSFENQIKLTIFSKFINDSDYQLQSINLRSVYDTFCLFYKMEINTNLLKDQQNQKELDAGLMLYAYVLNKPKKMFFILDEKNENYVAKSIKKIGNDPFYKLHWKYLLFSEKFKILINALYKKSYFNYVCGKIVDREWYKRKFGI